MRSIVCTLLFILTTSDSALATNVSRPNIILIMADDVGVDAIGCYGGTSYLTPNIDKFAQTGMRFQHCYSMPSCHPTRITLLTGRYPRRIGNPKWGSFPKEKEKQTIASIIKQSGYATAVAGKWQLSMLGKDLRQPHRMGFEFYSLFGWHEGPRYHQPLIWENGSKRDDVADRFGPDVYCDVLIDFMKNNHDKPFFAYFPMALCHDVTDDLKQPVPYGPHGRYESYAEMMAGMDRVFGRLIDAVDELALREKTLILFTGDNGTSMSSIIRFEKGQYIRNPVFSVFNGEKIRGGKTKLTNGGTNVPLIASWKGVITRGSVVDDLIDFSDFLPTLAEITGAKLPAGVTLDGKSFASRLKENHPGSRRWAYAEKGEQYWVRTQRWKLYNDNRLFDMKLDPFERQALNATDPPPAASFAMRVLKGALEQVTRFE
jgi:arylsulfatase A